MEDWQKVGDILEDLCAQGYYPAIGYDVNGWEAWIFIDQPVEGLDGNHVKVFAQTATEAIGALYNTLVVAGLWIGAERESNEDRRS